LFGELKGQGPRFIGHTSAMPALFSTAGVKLDEDGRSAHGTAFAAQGALGVESWIRGGKHDHLAAELEQPGTQAPQLAEAKQAAKAVTVDWDAKFHGLGAALSSGKPSARGGSSSNFAAFEQSPPKKKSGR
jgi:hypothetical protein